MELADLYTQYRQEEIRFIEEKIIPLITKEHVDSAVKLLDINMGISDNREIDIIMDFVIYELRVNGKNLIERYADEHEPENDIQAAVISAMLGQHASLYRIVNISREKKMLFLMDLLNDNVRNTRIIDLNLSSTAEPGLVAYTRVLSFKELNMTAGTAFLYPAELEKDLMNMYSVSKLHDKNPMEKIIFFYDALKTYEHAAEYFETNTSFNHSCEHEHHHSDDCECGHHHDH